MLDAAYILRSLDMQLDNLTIEFTYLYNTRRLLCSRASN